MSRITRAADYVWMLCGVPPIYAHHEPPVALRRAIVLTFPVSVPALFFGGFALMLLALPVAVVTGFGSYLRGMWR